jgi:hypothetical protein
MREPFFIYRNRKTKKIVVKTLHEARAFQENPRVWMKDYAHIATIEPQSFLSLILNDNPDLLKAIENDETN